MGASLAAKRLADRFGGDPLGGDDRGDDRDRGDAASLLTATRSELAMPLLLHHALPLFACDYVTRTHFGTAAILTALFQETTNPESNSTTSTPCSRLAGMPSAASATPGVRGR